MQHSLSHASSARKKLLQFQETIKRQQSQSGYLGRTLSKQHSKLMESILRQQIEKQQTQRVMKKQYSTKGYNSNLSSHNKSPSGANRKINIQMIAVNTIFKPLKTSRSNRYQQIKIDTNGQKSSVNENEDNTHPQFYKDTDQMRSARQNELMEVKKSPFKFSFMSYLTQIIIGYGLFVGILYLIKLGSFPYFELLFIIALTFTIHPWKISNFILPLTAIPITIINHYIGLSSLTYLQILICYLGTMAFNQKYKLKIIFIIVLVIEIVFGAFIFPSLYQSLKLRQQIYFYIYPLIMFALRNLVQFGYWMVGHTESLFLQITLFLIGLEYGTVLTIPVGDIQFWYLIVFFTLQIINDRTHFMLNVYINMVTFCFPSLKTTPNPNKINKNNNLLPPHWNGFSSIHSFHLIAAVYILTQLPVFSSPYNSTLNLSFYLQNGQWYKPLIVWALISIYQIMCIALQRRKQNVLLIGNTNNRWYMSISRGIMLVLGLWMFYIGFGVSAYSVQRLI